MNRMSIIKTTVIAFEKLKEIKYRLVLSAGREKAVEDLIIDFYDEDLFHILGLQHLSDIDLPKNKSLLISRIRKGIITDEYLAKSLNYDNENLEYNIKRRVLAATCIEEYFDSDNFTVSVYRLQHDNLTKIRADYLIICKKASDEDEYYIFIRKRKELDTYGIVSAFPKERIAYWGGKRYLLLKEKIVGSQNVELFRHPDYKDK